MNNFDNKNINLYDSGMNACPGNRNEDILLCS